MSRFLKTMVVLLTIAAFAAPALATDFSISGQMRAEGYFNDQDSIGDADMHWDQRLRLQSLWKVADDVKVVLRVDIGETQWGTTGKNTIRNPATNFAQMHIDKAYLQIDKELFSFSAGQQFFGTSNAILVDHVGTGLLLKLKTPVFANLMYTKYDENGSWVDEGATDDEDLYAVEVGFKNDTFSVSGIGATRIDSSTNGAQKTAYGVAGSMKLGIVALKAELDVLSGDNGGAIDYVGTQLYVDANANITEAFNIGGFLWYMAGTDDATEQVIVDVTNWDDFNPFLGGYTSQNIVAGQPISGWGANDFATNEGLMAAAVYATINVSDDLGLKAQAQYGMEAEDANADFDYMGATISGKYKVATNTYLMADIIYEDIDGSAAGVSFSDDSISFWSQLQVNF